MTDFLKIANKKFKSRIIVGTAKNKTYTESTKAIKYSNDEILDNQNSQNVDLNVLTLRNEEKGL